MALTLGIDETEFRACGADENPKSKLVAELIINGIPHHLMALEVTEEAGIQEGADNIEEEFNELFLAFGAVGNYQTVKIGGRLYALFVDPYAR